MGQAEANFREEMLTQPLHIRRRVQGEVYWSRGGVQRALFQKEPESSCSILLYIRYRGFLLFDKGRNKRFVPSKKYDSSLCTLDSHVVNDVTKFE